ncbi:MAG: hypothetical protein Kow0077_30740 [Anaerolineae bacterium]
MRQKRLFAAGLILLIVLLTLWGTVSAAESYQGDQCVIPADEIIDSDVYVICNTLAVEGTIRGDLIGSAWSTVITGDGRVMGDIWLLGGQLQIEGQVDDDVRFAGVDLDVKPSADFRQRSDITAVGLNVEIWDGATLPGNLYFFGYQAVLLGTVERDVSFNGAALVIGGDVQGDVYASVGSGDTSPSFIPFPFPFTVSFQSPGLTVRSGGEVGGNLDYRGARPGNINGRIGGEITFTLDTPRPDITQAALEQEETSNLELVGRYLRNVLTDMLALMVAGVLVAFLAPAWTREPSRLVTRHVASSFGWGLILALMAVPVSLIVLVVSVLVLVLLGTVTLGGFTGMGLLLGILLNAFVIGGFSFVILFMARLVIGYLIGSRVMRRFMSEDDRRLFILVSLLVGTLIYALVANLPVPVVGPTLNAIGIFLGLGAMALHGRALYQRTLRAYRPFNRGPAPLPAAPPALEVLRGATPEPPPDSTSYPAPGMSNLPEGFKWWESK